LQLSHPPNHDWAGLPGSSEFERLNLLRTIPLTFKRFELADACADIDIASLCKVGL
jgi:hypothetical protein